MRKKIKEQMLTAYHRHLTDAERSSATIDKYMRDLRQFYQFLPAGKRIDKGDIIAYKRRLIEQYKPASVNSMLAAVNGFLSFIGCKDYRVQQVRIQRQLFLKENCELTRSDYHKLTEAAKKKNQRLFLIIQTIGSTGIRISELPYITAEAILHGYADVSCKNKIRRIFLPAKLCRLLKKYAANRGITTGPLFLTRNGTRLGRSNIWREMKALSSDSGISPEKIFPHNLRHLFARTYYEKEKDILKLADILGHSSVETTRIYTASSGREHLLHMEHLGLVVADT